MVSRQSVRLWLVATVKDEKGRRHTTKQVALLEEDGKCPKGSVASCERSWGKSRWPLRLSASEPKFREGATECSSASRGLLQGPHSSALIGALASDCPQF